MSKEGMIPSKEEVEAALSWADARERDTTMNIDTSPMICLAAALRRSEADLNCERMESYRENRNARIYQARAEKAESRLKTLEEENARMRVDYDKLKDERDELKARLAEHEGPRG